MPMLGIGGFILFREMSLPGIRIITVYSALLISLMVPGLYGQSEGAYYPFQTGEWESRSPEDVGMDGEALQKAVDLGWSRASILTDPCLDGLRGDPDFESIVQEVQENLGR